MGYGDILILYTDGLSEHGMELEEQYFPLKMQETLRRIKSQSASEIYAAIMDELLHFAEPADDIGIVVIKKL